MKGKVAALALALATFACGSPDDGAPAGHYESYVLALEWEPGFSNYEYLCDPAVASHMSPTAYAAQYLSVHGLWPNYNATLHDGMSWPQYCVKPSGENYQLCESDIDSEPYCTPTAATATFNNTDYWQSFALDYAWGDLASHEWSKHGSCTNWTDTEYFKQINTMYNRLIGGVGSTFVSANVGEKVSFSDLNSAFEQDTNGKTVSLVCTDCVFDQVWTAWAADPVTLEPTTPIDISDTSSCESCDSVLIPAWTTTGTCP